jgi:hypothetical protein
VGEFTPILGCRWTPPQAPPGASTEEIEIAGMSEVVMTPAVANLTDDNGDGITDTLDTPDIVFVSFDYAVDGCCTKRGVVRVVSGACKSDGTMTTHATLKGLASGDWIGNSTGIALGNLHPDDMADERAPEIVATFKNGGTIAWRRIIDDGSAWEILWQNDALPTNQHTRGGAQPSIADLNADGRPEVIVGNVVLDGLTGKGAHDPDLPAGALAWDGRDLELMTPGANLGIGNNAFLGPVSTVADLDRDGLQEVIAGNTVYNYDGTERWTFGYSTTNSSCGGSLDCDGYDAVGNFDGDDDAEVVIIRLGELFILNHDGSAVDGIPLPIRIPGFDDDVAEPTYSPAAYDPSTPLYDEDGDLLPPERILCGGALDLAAYDFDGNPVMSDGAQVVVHTAGANESGPTSTEMALQRSAPPARRPTWYSTSNAPETHCPRGASSSGYDGWSRTTTAPAVSPGRVCSISRAMGRRKSCTRMRRAFGYSKAPTGRFSTRIRATAATRVWKCPSSSMSIMTVSRRS